jgi:hypothetical protein
MMRAPAGVLALGFAILIAGCGDTHNSTTIIKTDQAPEERTARTTPSNDSLSALRQIAEKDGVSCAVYPPGSCQTNVQISEINPNWGASYIGPQPGYEGEVQPDKASFRRSSSGRWTPVQVGNGGGCKVPQPIRDELKLDCY